jgi:hypothetical protein
MTARVLMIRSESEWQMQVFESARDAAEYFQVFALRQSAEAPESCEVHVGVTVVRPMYGVVNAELVVNGCGDYVISDPRVTGVVA